MYYHCTKKRSACDGAYLREEALDTELSNLLSRFHLPREWAEEMEILNWQNGNYADGAKLLITNLPSKKWVHVKARSLGTFNRNSPWCEAVRVFVY